MTGAGRGTRALGLAALAAAGAACASGLQVGPPLPDPGAAAEREADFPLERGPALLRFGWEYADERGSVEGDGAARANPPDSLRVDLFTSGDVSLAAALASSRLTTSGRIENVELPSPPFLYAMAGLFRPQEGGPEAAFSTDRGTLLRYRANGGLRREYLIDGGRLLRLEDRRDGRMLRRVTVRWDSGGAWPRSAEYRSTVEPRRVRWRVRDVESRSQPFDPDIYDLPREALHGRP